MHNDFPDLSIQQLLSNNQYSVPRYQRNYAWTEEHIKQLIDDVLDNAKEEKAQQLPYYLGTLVVFPRQQGNQHIYEVIDGQQRLTTLTLLASYLTFDERNKAGNDHWYGSINLDFESRKRSSETLSAAHNGSFHDSGHQKSISKNYIEEIVIAYEIIQRILPERCLEKGVKNEQFQQYFLNQVRICRVDVPTDTDLNHYFEIMNNRGEQLEKHEVLKARLLSKLEAGTNQYAFNKIWEACSAMDKYIQYGFEKDVREKLFGSRWDRIEPGNAEELYRLMVPNVSSSDRSVNGNENGPLLADLIKGRKGIDDAGSDKKIKVEEPERFSSIINFQNFLPHVLSIFLRDGSVMLDDKQLLDSFSVLENSTAERIKGFSYALLKMRFLFDQYIIKRDANEDEREWSLKKLHQTEQGNPSYRHSFSEINDYDLTQRQITLLQSMFHVSVPSRPYKYWLQGALRHLHNTPKLSAEGFHDYLKDQAKAFVFNRFLALQPLDYNRIIFENDGKAVQTVLDLTKTSYGQIENILVFNFIDYLLWEQEQEKDENIKGFVFTFRSSVEHYYPQNPIDGNALKDEEVLHSVGNLCLISHSKNSMLRHNLPKGKAEYYIKQPYIDSILQHKMLSKADKWSANPVESIRRQERVIFELLETNQP